MSASTPIDTSSGSCRRLQQLLLRWAAMVEERSPTAIEALVDRDTELARGGHRPTTARSTSSTIEIDEQLPEAARAPPAGGGRPALHHRGAEDQHRPRAHRRHGGQHLRARARAGRGAAAQALHRHAAHGRAWPAAWCATASTRSCAGTRTWPREVIDARRRGRRALRTRSIRELLSYMIEDPRTIARATRILLVVAKPRAHRRPRDEHRRDGGVHGRRADSSATRRRCRNKTRRANE